MPTTDAIPVAAGTSSASTGTPRSATPGGGSDSAQDLEGGEAQREARHERGDPERRALRKAADGGEGDSDDDELPGGVAGRHARRRRTGRGSRHGRWLACRSPRPPRATPAAGRAPRGAPAREPAFAPCAGGPGAAGARAPRSRAGAGHGGADCAGAACGSCGALRCCRGGPGWRCAAFAVAGSPRSGAGRRVPRSPVRRVPRSPRSAPAWRRPRRGDPPGTTCWPRPTAPPRPAAPARPPSRSRPAPRSGARPSRS